MKFIYFLLFSGLVFVSCNTVQGGGVGDNLSLRQNVVLPHLPKSIDFAGEEVPLDKFSISQSLMNEVIITQNMHSATLRVLLSSKRYFDIIEPILAKNNIPDDFKYLCVAESGLYPEAYSPARAAGLWQLLASTAKENGLEVTADIDERYHFEKSCQAACDFLNNSYERFGSWTLVAASYNMGMTGLRKRITQQEEESFYSLALPIETMRYIFRILSFKIFFENPDAMGFYLSQSQFYPPFETKEVEVGGLNIDWAKVAKRYNTDFRTLRVLNPWIRDCINPNKSGKKYNLKILRDDEK